MVGETATYHRSRSRTKYTDDSDNGVGDAHADGETGEAVLILYRLLSR